MFFSSALLLALFCSPSLLTSSPNQSPLADVLQSPHLAEDSSTKITPPLTYIPPIGIGLWQAKDADATKAVEYAIKAGYRHLDSAAAYGNEDYVGKGIANVTLPRSTYWITSKLWNTAHRPADVKPALVKTLSQLGVDYLDLYLMHWPVAFDPTKSGSVLDKGTSILDTWRAMEDLVRLGLTKTIGISNFSPAQVKSVLDNCEICPAAHEFETHPYLQQADFVAWHRAHGIQVIAYSPLANLNPIYDSDQPPILKDPFWVKLAENKNVTVAQAVLAWGMQRGVIVIPKSVHEARIVENLGSEMVRLSSEEMEMVSKHDKKIRYNNPSKGWGVNLFDGLDDS